MCFYRIDVTDWDRTDSLAVVGDDDNAVVGEEDAAVDHVPDIVRLYFFSGHRVDVIPSDENGLHLKTININLKFGYYNSLVNIILTSVGFLTSFNFSVLGEG